MKKKSHKETEKFGQFTGRKRKLSEILPEEVQTLDLLDKNFKSTVLYMRKVLKKTMNKELKETERIMYMKCI